MVKPLNVLMLAIWMVIGLWSSSLVAAEIQVRASRDPLFQTESFSLIFSTGEDPDGDPDFTPLRKDFDILDQGKSTNFQFINGHKSHSITWTLELLPKRSGDVTLPPLAFGKDRSTPITLKILPARSKNDASPAADHSELLVEAEVNNQTPHLQEQIILTIRFLNAIPIASASMPEPKMGSGDAMIEKLGSDQAYESERNGRRYLVSERRYALFPQRSGALVIDPIPVTVQLPGQGGSSLLKELFNDPFIKNLPLGPGRGGQTVRLATQPLKLETKPQPAEWKSPHWLPAHRLILAEKWSPDPPRFQVGEPITRTVTLMADGLTAAQLPALSPHSPEAIKLYPDRPLLEDQKEATGIIGKRSEKIAMIPTAPGEQRLPAIEIPWWNIDQRKIEFARLPEQRITVLAATDAARSTAPEAVRQPEPQSTTLPQSTLAQKSPNASDARQTPNASNTPHVPNASNTPQAPNTSGAPATLPTTPEPNASGAPSAFDPQRSNPPAGLSFSGMPWPWIALLLGLGWLITGLLWWRSGLKRHAPTPAPPPHQPDRNLRETEEQLRRACLADDPSAARAALGRLPDALHAPALSAQIAQLEAALYGRESGSWRGAPLWEAY
ncbi:MAG: protein BatD, partial [Magnetococcales bacterium]|nr:protein BatD [Magnetococcales bacterium]